jgi:hypothetical protein
MQGKSPGHVAPHRLHQDAGSVEFERVFRGQQRVHGTITGCDFGAAGCEAVNDETKG